MNTELLRLHLGGVEPRAGWKILNVQPGPGVDFVGDCADLARFADESVEQIYASHVYEHLSYAGAVQQALREAWRVLRPGGSLLLAVPDLEILCELFRYPGLAVEDRLKVMRMIYGGQIDEHDYHRSGFSFETLAVFLGEAGFRTATRVPSFGLFQDTSEMQFGGNRISLCVEAVK